MAQFTALAALFLVLLTVVNASQQSQRCQREIQGMRMNMCQQYLRQRTQGSVMETTNPTGQMKQQCCREMRDVSENCRCEAVNMMMHEMMRRGEYQGQEMREMMQTARQLPSMCNMRPQYCEIRGTTTEVETGRPSERCQREMQGMHMNRCQQYLQQSTQGLLMETTNPTGQMKQQCCREMRDVSENCRCEAVNMMMHEMMRRGEYQGQEMREMMQTARQLPSMCNMRPQYCEIRGTTTEVETGRPSERCQREMQGMHMNRCQQYLQQSTQGLLMVTTNPSGQMKQQCCREMRDVSENCRCEAVNMMMHEMMRRGEYQGQEMREMMQTARQLPSMCNMRPQYCEIRGTGY